MTAVDTQVLLASSVASTLDPLHLVLTARDPPSSGGTLLPMHCLRVVHACEREQIVADAVERVLQREWFLRRSHAHRLALRMVDQAIQPGRVPDPAAIRSGQQTHQRVQSLPPTDPIPDPSPSPAVIDATICPHSPSQHRTIPATEARRTPASLVAAARMPDLFTIACFVGGLVGMLWFTGYAFVLYHMERLEAIDEACEEQLEIKGDSGRGNLYHQYVHPRLTEHLLKWTVQTKESLETQQSASFSNWDSVSGGLDLLDLFGDLQRALCLDGPEWEQLLQRSKEALHLRFRFLHLPRYLERCAEDECHLYLLRKMVLEDFVE